MESRKAEGEQGKVGVVESTFNRMAINSILSAKVSLPIPHAAILCWNREWTIQVYILT